MTDRKEKRAAKGKASVPRHREKVTRRNVFAQAAIQRLRDSRMLLKARRYIGAMYLGGYVIECFLKFLICNRYDVEHLEDWEWQVAKRTGRKPDATGAKGHLLEALLEHAGLLEIIRGNAQAYQLFRTVNSQWYVGLRYYAGQGSVEDASRFLKAAEALYDWLLRRSFP
jgi:hypothetical protein